MRIYVFVFLLIQCLVQLLNGQTERDYIEVKWYGLEKMCVYESFEKFVTSEVTGYALLNEEVNIDNGNNKP